MKVIAFEAGRETWLFPVEEFVPLNGASGVEIIAGIAERYNFTHKPENPKREDIDKNGLKFESGHFKFNDERAGITEFIAFNDGIVAAALHTEIANAFLEDLYKFVVKEFRFRETTSRVKKVNLSAIVVEFQASLSAMLTGYQRVMEAISEDLNSRDETSNLAEAVRLDFSLNKDPEFRASNVPRFVLEKRTNTLSSQRRYFSSSPTTTKRHLATLEKIEKMLVSQSS